MTTTHALCRAHRQGRAGRRRCAAAGTTRRPSARRNCAAPSPRRPASRGAAVAGHGQVGTQRSGFSRRVAVGARRSPCRRYESARAPRCCAAAGTTAQPRRRAPAVRENPTAAPARCTCVAPGSRLRSILTCVPWIFIREGVDHAVRQLRRTRHRGPARRAAAACWRARCRRGSRAGSRRASPSRSPRTPARASSRPSIIPAGPPPAMMQPVGVSLAGHPAIFAP